MDLVTILRTLWHRRALVAVAAALSVLVGIVAAYHVTPAGLTSRQYTVAVAQARFLIDTPQSQVLAFDAPTTADATSASDLASRANLLANLIPTSPVKAAIAKRAGIPPSELVIVAPRSPDATGPTPLEASQEAKAVDRKANIINISLAGATDSPLPVISVETQAPRTETAARLANATIDGLGDFLGSVPGTQTIPEARKIVRRQLGDAQVATVVHGPRRLYALVLPLVLFVLACAGIAFFPHIARTWREIVAPEREATSDDELRGPGRMAPAPSKRAGDQSPGRLRDLETDAEPERVAG